MAVQDIWVCLCLCGVIFIAQITCLQLTNTAPQLSFKRSETNVWWKLRWKQTGRRKECWKNFEDDLQITNSPLFLQVVLLNELGKSKYLFFFWLPENRFAQYILICSSSSAFCVELKIVSLFFFWHVFQTHGVLDVNQFILVMYLFSGEEAELQCGLEHLEEGVHNARWELLFKT